MSTSLRSSRLWIALGALTLLPLAAAGPITLFTSSSAFPTNDTVAWIPTSTNHLFNPPLATTSANGIAITGSLAGPDSILVELPCSNGSTASDFTPCEHILDNNAYGPLTLTFATPIAGLGAQFDGGGVVGAFTAELSVYSGATLLGGVTEAGNATRNEDGSATFLGFTSTVPVTSVVVNTASGNFSVGTLSLDDTLPADPVPEPPAWALAGTGLLLLLCGFALRPNRGGAHA